MRKIEGHVFVAKFDFFEPLFGKSIHYPKNKYESFNSNDFTTFDSLDDTVEGAKDFLLKIRDAREAIPAELFMRIAETREETEKLKGKSSLVVIMISGEQSLGNNDIFGACVEGKQSAYPLHGARLIHNGYQPFNRVGRISAYKQVYDAAYEINRQGQSGAKIAQFKIKFLPRYKVTRR